MNIKRILPIALGSALIAAASVQGFAFMSASDETPVAAAHIDVTKMVDGLRAEMGTEVVAINKLAKLNEALDTIDEALDLGVQDEDALLSARDEIVEMRMELSGKDKKLAHGPAPVLQGGSGTGVLGGSGSILGGGGVLGGGSILGGGGGAIGGGGAAIGGSSALLAAGAVAAVAIPAATSDDDEPGDAASPAN